MLTKDYIDSAVETFTNLSVFDAVECLCTVFGATTAIVYINDETCQVLDIYDFPEIYDDVLARNFEVGFYGGPPGKSYQRHGSLLTLFLDHFLYAHVTGRQSAVIKALAYVKT